MVRYGRPSVFGLVFRSPSPSLSVANYSKLTFTYFCHFFGVGLTEKDAKMESNPRKGLIKLENVCVGLETLIKNSVKYVKALLCDICHCVE